MTQQQSIDLSNKRVRVEIRLWSFITMLFTAIVSIVCVTWKASQYERKVWQAINASAETNVRQDQDIKEIKQVIFPPIYPVKNMAVK